MSGSDLSAEVCCASQPAFRHMETVLDLVEVCINTTRSQSLEKASTLVNELCVPFRYAADIADQLECACQWQSGDFVLQAREVQKRALVCVENLKKVIQACMENERKLLCSQHRKILQQLKDFEADVANKAELRIHY